jgi:DNA-binding beta-propeller fold protein YncE
MFLRDVTGPLAQYLGKISQERTSKMFNRGHTLLTAAAVILSCITCTLTPARPASAEYTGPIPITLRYLFSFSARTSGTRTGWVNQILIDEEHEEVYLMDRGSGRIVVANFAGTFLYQIKYGLEGVKSPLHMEINPGTGDIYVSEQKRIVVLNYRGKYKKEVDLSTIPDRDKLSIQSFTLVPDNEGGRIYIGDSGTGRIVVLSIDGEFIQEFDRETVGSGNFKGLHVNGESITYLDSSGFTVHRLSLEGKRLTSFGRVSGLLGGFSMPVELAVDEVKGRILVVDANRMMVIAFDMNGNVLYEFGGPAILVWPRAVAVNRRGQVYVADNSGNVRVFEPVEERVEEEEKPEEAVDTAAPEP